MQKSDESAARHGTIHQHNDRVDTYPGTSQRQADEGSDQTWSRRLPAACGFTGCKPEWTLWPRAVVRREPIQTLFFASTLNDRAGELAG